MDEEVVVVGIWGKQLAQGYMAGVTESCHLPVGLVVLCLLMLTLARTWRWPWPTVNRNFRCSPWAGVVLTQVVESVALGSYCHPNIIYLPSRNFRRSIFLLVPFEVKPGGGCRRMRWYMLPGYWWKNSAKRWVIAALSHTSLGPPLEGLDDCHAIYLAVQELRSQAENWRQYDLPAGSN